MNIRDISTEALECRDNRCHWDHQRKFDQRDPMWGTYRWDLCVNGCGNERRRIECSDGSISPGSTHYEYSPMYEAAKEYTREDARKELNRRARSKPLRVTDPLAARRKLRAVS